MKISILPLKSDKNAQFSKIPEYLVTNLLIFATFIADCYEKIEFFKQKNQKITLSFMNQQKLIFNIFSKNRFFNKFFKDFFRNFL